MESEDGECTIGAALSLSDGNVRQARMAAAGLVQAVDDARRAGGLSIDGRAVLPRLALLDDGGTAKGLRHALDLLAGADLLIGPYGSGLAGEAGRRRLQSRPRAVAAVAGGLREFAEAVGPRRAEGILAPSQWEEGVRLRPDVGPRTVEVLRGLRFRLAPGLAPGTSGAHVEYPAAQAYAAVVIALRCAADTGGFDDDALQAVARALRCTTFFGRFGLAPDGRQADHAIVVVQWQDGAKCIVGPPGQAEQAVRFSS